MIPVARLLTKLSAVVLVTDGIDGRQLLSLMLLGRRGMCVVSSETRLALLGTGAGCDATRRRRSGLGRLVTTGTVLSGVLALLAITLLLGILVLEALLRLGVATIVLRGRRVSLLAVGGSRIGVVGLLVAGLEVGGHT
jgi:hypothetical protein